MSYWHPAVYKTVPVFCDTTWTAPPDLHLIVCERELYACSISFVTFSSSLTCVSSDDSASAASSMEVTDRIASLEQRVQMQEDEIQLLKSALADVVRRLNASEEQQAMGSRRGPTKGNIFTSAWSLSCFFRDVEQQGLLEISVFRFLSWSCLLRNSLISFLWLVVGLLCLSLPPVLSSPGLCCVVKRVVRHVYRPCFDEKVFLSRQQCWEARYADCEVLSALTRPGVVFTKEHPSVTACWNSIVYTVVFHQETHSYCQYYTAWGQCTVVWVWR